MPLQQPIDGFAHFGFSEDEADEDPFHGVKRMR